MDENTVKISELQRATEAADTDLIPIDDGTLTKAITIGDLNDSSNQTAKAYAEASAASAQTAADTVANINTKVDLAQGYANTASQQAGYAQTYASNAETYAGNAQGYANTAQGHASNASASATSASSSADSASSNAVLAQSWAEGNTGAREGENTNNARYWANKAESAAQITIDDHLDPQSTNPVENKVIYDAINSMHTGGSNIEVTTSQSRLYGKTVTITDGTTTLTGAFDLTGKALFEGVQMTGSLTISSSDGTRTATGTLTVPYFGNYTKAISIWEATIAVTTTTSQFNGLTVSAKKNGAVVATGTFSSGSATITVPETGTYKLEVTLDWQTYESSSISVTDQTTYNATLNGFIAPISLTTPTTEFYNKSIAVTCDGVTITPSTPLAFNGSGSASFTALKAGTYVFTLTYGGEPYTASVTVSAATSYSAVIKRWTATINVTTPSTQMQSKSVDVYKGSTKVDTISFNASGSASYLAHETGTYHFVCTVDNYAFRSADVSVSAETTYSTTITYFAATLSISTSSSDLYSQSITIKKGSTTVGTTAFSSGGSATYVVHETGTFTATCKTYSGSATVSSQTTYTITINSGLSLASWLTAGGLNPSSYANFAAVEADEAAVHRLMTVHASVDYVATARAGDSLVSSIINSNVCAKWINLRDYAYDTLSANANIKSVMNTADKYGYGEWGKINSTTWGALGNIPIMTANNAPYGVVTSSPATSGYEAYKAFDGNSSDQYSSSTKASAGMYIGYGFVNPVIAKKAKLVINLIASGGIIAIKATNNPDGTWTELGRVTSTGTEDTTFNISLNNSTAYMYYRAEIVSVASGQSYGFGVKTFQLYGRELKPLVPTMTATDKPKGTCDASTVYSGYPAWQGFDGNKGTFWISNGKTNQHIGYTFPSAVCVKAVSIAAYSSSTNTVKNFKVQYGTNNTDVYTGTVPNNTDATKVFGYSFNNTVSSNYWRVFIVDEWNSSINIQLTEVQFYGVDYSERDFATSSTYKTIYDHGVAPSGAITGGTKNPDCLTLSAVGTAVVTIDKGTRTYMGGKAGLHASGTNRLKCGSGYSAFTASNMPDSNGFDISSISGSVAIGIEQTASGTFDCAEIWIE